MLIVRCFLLSGRGNDPIRVLSVLAWLNVAFHAAGLVLAVVALRAGTALVPLSERMSFLAGKPLLWRLGWGVWMICALLLVAYLAAAERLLRSLTARVAVTFAAAGMGVDLLCEIINLSVLPEVASSGTTELFLAFERMAFAGGATVANGLYTTAVLLLTRALGARASALTRASGYGAVIAGYLMAVAGILPSPVLVQYATGATIGLFCLWVLVVVTDLRTSGEPRP